MKNLLKITAFVVFFCFIFSVCTLACDIPLLVNKSYPLPADYVPQRLTELKSTRNDGRAVQMMCFSAAKALDKMLSDLNAAFRDQAPVTVTSGYRSYEYQKSLYDAAIQNHTERFTAPPGASEHQSGLAADLHDMTYASADFAKSEKYLWLCENAYKYGFILRYPKGMESITGYAFEPWHWRYVGRFHAEKIRSSGMCLEEYIENLKN